MRPGAASAQFFPENALATFDDPVPSPGVNEILSTAGTQGDTMALPSLPSPPAVSDNVVGAVFSPPVLSPESESRSPTDSSMPGGYLSSKPSRPYTSALAVANDSSANSDMNLLVGGALVPAALDLTCRKNVHLPKAGPGLQLPSFELLGIANPHPDRPGSLLHLDGGFPTNFSEEAGINHTDALIDGQNVMHDITRGVLTPARSDMSVECAQAVDLAERRDELLRKTSFSTPPAMRTVLSPNTPPEIAILTPPAEIGSLAWPQRSEVKPTVLPGLSTTISDDAQLDEQESSGKHMSKAPSLSSTDRVCDGRHPPESTLQSEYLNAPEWVRPALRKLLENVQNASGPADSALKVLSHALPRVSTTGHVFSHIINDIHMAPPTERTEWINVLHAIPGEYNLERLPPTSPPSTPGPAIGGDDYFTKKVFDNAVTILDYQNDLSVQAPSPNRAVASPASVNVSIVERYIPPTNCNEFADMFKPDGPSILVDRLVELSPNNGSLLFIYPNKTGAARFYNDYLEPLKAPSMRALAMQYNVPMSIGQQLETIDKTIVEQLPDHSAFDASLRRLCKQLTQGSSKLRNFRNKACAFEVVHEERIVLPPFPVDQWLNDWWIPQEKRTLRQFMQQHFIKIANRQTIDPHRGLPPADHVLAQQLLADIVRRANRASLPTQGIEVSVFVIKRSA